MLEIAVAIAAHACMQGWNAAEHRKDEWTARVLSVAFFVLLVLLMGMLLWRLKWW